MFGMKKKKPMISRERAFAAKPRKLPVVRMSEQPEGGIQVTVALKRPAILRFFSPQETYEKTYALDSIGREVYERCDGKSRVSTIIGDFTRKYKVSGAEAESSVSMFLSMLMRKGLIAMSLEEK